MNSMFYVFGIALFIAVVLGVEGAYLRWTATRGAEARRLERRLQAMSAAAYGGEADFSLLKQRLMSESPAMQRLLLSVPRVHALDRLLQQSGTGMTVGRFCGLTAFCGVTGFLATRYFPVPMAISLVCGLLTASVPFFHVLRRRRRRLVRMEQQLPDAVDLIGRALRAGHAFPNAVKMVGDEMNEPIASEFATLFDEVNYGIAMQDALLNFAHRIPIMDVKYFVIAVLIQRDTGGNLAEVLDNISSIIRARLKLLGQIRVLSAEGRLSALILSLLPFGTAFVIWLVNPGFMTLLWTDPAGHRMIYSMVVMMLLGIAWMRKIIRIRV